MFMFPLGLDCAAICRQTQQEKFTPHFEKPLAPGAMYFYNKKSID